MAHDVRCKRIIDGKTYNTETATLLGRWLSRESSPREVLYKTRHGAYFLYVASDGVPNKLIEPKEPEATQKWMQQHCSAEAVEAEFGNATETKQAGAHESRFTVRMPATLRKRLAAIAKKQKHSLNAWIVRSLESSASDVVNKSK
jgi:predicted HicB family RNase H-like nuclease